MVNKYNWHKAWQKLPNGRLWHESGLQVEYNDNLGWVSCNDTIDAFQQFEMARGVPLHDIQNRLTRLLKEASLWRSNL